MKKCCLSTLLSLFIAPLAIGALLLADIQRYQKEAPEKLTIKTTTIERKDKKVDGSHTFMFKVAAVVTAVEKTSSEIKVGDTIHIAYSIPNLEKSPAAGDWPGEVAPGAIYKSYLRKLDPGFVPAAYSGSFEIKN